MVWLDFHDIKISVASNSPVNLQEMDSTIPYMNLFDWWILMAKIKYMKGQIKVWSHLNWSNLARSECLCARVCVTECLRDLHSLFHLWWRVWSWAMLHTGFLHYLDTQTHSWPETQRTYIQEHLEKTECLHNKIFIWFVFYAFLIGNQAEPCWKITK